MNARAAVAAVVLQVAGLVAVASPAEAVARPVVAVAPCRFEDGSGQRVCVWDARHRGNGVGRSVLVIRSGRHLERETVLRISHRDAHRFVSAWRLARAGAR